MTTNYLFTSERLGFRNWKESDLDEFAFINSDIEVMQYFPAKQSKEQTKLLIEKMKTQYKKNGFCYFAVENLENEQFIGMIGLSEQIYESPFNPSIDIGWRISRDHWNKGYATEGAKRCLEYGFNTCKITEIYSVAPVINIKSEHVMKKIGLKKRMTFKHPLLKAHKNLEKCNAYSIKNSEFLI